MFQSLGRDSVGFSAREPAPSTLLAFTFQSLGRDSVGFSFYQSRLADAMDK